MSKVKKLVICILSVVLILIVFIFVKSKYSTQTIGKETINEVSNVIQNNTIVAKENDKENKVENTIQDVANEEVTEKVENEETKKTTNIVNNKQVVEEEKKETVKTDNKKNTEQQQPVTKKENTTPTQQKEVEKTETTSEDKTQSEIVKEEKEKVEKCTNSNNHGIEAGNTGKWYNTKGEAVAIYDKLTNDLGQQWEKFEISDEYYEEHCPFGYEVWTCPFCGKWTINYYYN